MGLGKRTGQRTLLQGLCARDIAKLHHRILEEGRVGVVYYNTMHTFVRGSPGPPADHELRQTLFMCHVIAP